jgi:hypothetical protein
MGSNEAADNPARAAVAGGPHAGRLIRTDERTVVMAGKLYQTQVDFASPQEGPRASVIARTFT